MSTTDTRALLIDMELALSFGRSVEANTVVNRAARKMQGIGYRGCDQTLQILAQHPRAYSVWGHVRRSTRGVL